MIKIQCMYTINSHNNSAVILHDALHDSIHVHALLSWVDASYEALSSLSLYRTAFDRARKI